MQRIRPPTSVSVTLALLLLNAAIWLLFALLGAIGWIPVSGVMRWAMVVLALGSCAVLAGMAFFLWKRSRPAFYLSTASLAAVAVLSIADQFGLPDLFTLLISLAALVLLLKDRAWYLRMGG